jgi:cytochrome c553
VPNETETSYLKNKMMKRIVLMTAALLGAGIAFTHAADAKETWSKSCIKCHGADGRGATPMGKKLNLKDFTDAKVQASFTDEEAFKAIKEGVKDGDKTRMKPAENVTDADIKGLIAHVRALKK